jgi:hypothetical protein
MLLAGQLPHASERTMATFALSADVETTVAVSFSMPHLLSVWCEPGKAIADVLSTTCAKIS